jgi:hypothetical protein
MSFDKLYELEKELKERGINYSIFDAKDVGAYSGKYINFKKEGNSFIISKERLNTLKKNKLLKMLDENLNIIMIKKIKGEVDARRF